MLSEERWKKEPEIEGSRDTDALWRGMPQALEREAHWLHRARNASTRLRHVLLFSALVLPLIAIRVALARADWASLPAWPLGWLFVVNAGLMGLSAWACLRPLHRRGPSPGLQDALLFAAAALSAVNALLPEPYLHSEALHGIGEAQPLRAVGCFVWGFAIAALGVALAFGVLRGPRGLGSVPGSVWALGILFAQLALALHCPLVSQLHLALGHASLSAALVVVVLVARGWARWAHPGPEAGA